MEDTLILTPHEMGKMLDAFSASGCVFSGTPWFTRIDFPTGDHAFAYGENGKSILRWG